MHNQYPNHVNVRLLQEGLASFQCLEALLVVCACRGYRQQGGADKQGSEGGSGGVRERL